MSKYRKIKTLRDALNQLRKGQFTDKNKHPLENSVAFCFIESLLECDGMATNHDCKNDSTEHVCEGCLDRIYESHQG